MDEVSCLPAELETRKQIRTMLVEARRQLLRGEFQEYTMIGEPPMPVFIADHPTKRKTWLELNHEGNLQERYGGRDPSCRHVTLIEAFSVYGYQVLKKSLYQLVGPPY